VKKYPFFCKKVRVDLRYEVDALMYIYDRAELITTMDLNNHRQIAERKLLLSAKSLKKKKNQG